MNPEDTYETIELFLAAEPLNPGAYDKSTHISMALTQGELHDIAQGQASRRVLMQIRSWASRVIGRFQGQVASVYVDCGDTPGCNDLGTSASLFVNADAGGLFLGSLDGMIRGAVEAELYSNLEDETADAA